MNKPRNQLTVMVICEDLGIAPWWQPEDARASVERFNASQLVRD